ncbi:hypothetical protein B0O99DRAFT_517475 [Bisporella sp. PMI_857]|nr:hypothetical protein B0O99DRAFT_517475 [Bisporella sp. PMI_857]
MDSTADKEERKREYNRLAQREFRRRRKEHLKNLEQAQKEQNTEQTEEIERLRYQNEELRRENEALKAQLYGTTSSAPHALMPMSAPLHVPGDGRQYSLSPSISGASLSGTGSPPASLPSDLIPMSALSLTSSMLQPSMHARMMASYEVGKARAEIMKLFQPLYSDASIMLSADQHLRALQSLSDNLPEVLKPTRAQLEKAHFVGIDYVPSPALRDRLLNVPSEVAQGFLDEIGFNGENGKDAGQLIIWGDNALNEMSWEFSQPILKRWRWLLGSEWEVRTNYWRQQRGQAPLLL